MDRVLDRRVMPEAVRLFVAKVQTKVRARLAGGVALSAAYLRHRLSNDVDLFVESVEDVRRFVETIPDLEEETRRISLRQDSGAFVRYEIAFEEGPTILDVAVDRAFREMPCESIEGVEVAPLAEIRAAKLTCLLSRSEPRDLVDLLFLDRGGFPPEQDLELALRKDAGIDPLVLAWLLETIPVEPLPQMLSPLTIVELREFRDALRERLRRGSLP